MPDDAGAELARLIVDNQPCVALTGAGSFYREPANRFWGVTRMVRNAR
jgi:G:T/U-mismatch repair DNA glycosylase